MVRIGIVGAGTRGRLYARSLHEFQGAKVVGICDPSATERARVAAEFPFEVYQSHQELLGNEQLDAVIVATPDFAHLQAALDAAHAGLHMLIEKPLATSVEDAHVIRDAVRASRVQCMVAFENRWNPVFLRAHELVLSGSVGEVLSQTARLSNSYSVPTQMLNWSSQTSPGWFLMPHTVDLALWLSKKQPSKVYATGFKRELHAKGIDTWDAIHALLTFTDGTIANLESLWIMPDSMPSVVDFKYELVGSRSAIYADQQDQMLRVASEDFSFPRTLPLEVDGHPQGPPVWMATYFVRKLLCGEPVSPNVNQGVLVTEVVQAIHDSLVEGTPQALA